MGQIKYKDPNTGNYREIYVKVTDTLPVGAIVAYSGITAPSGYLICDGSAVSRTEYADLFKAIGTSHGSGDGLTTFNLPDFRGRNITGLDGRDTDFDTIGKTGGSKTHTLKQSEMPADTPVITQLNSGDWSLGYWKQWDQSSPAYGAVLPGQHGTSSQGQPHNIMNPHAVENFIIKASKKVAIDKGNVVDSLTGNDTDSAPSVRAVKEALQEKGKVLWTNPNPTSAFESQDITLNSDDYDMLEIYYLMFTNNNNYVQSVKITKGYSTRIMTYTSQLAFSYRDITYVNNTTYSIANESSSNDRCVPYKIIGYKN